VPTIVLKADSELVLTEMVGKVVVVVAAAPSVEILKLVGALILIFAIRWPPGTLYVR